MKPKDVAKAIWEADLPWWVWLIFIILWVIHPINLSIKF